MKRLRRSLLILLVGAGLAGLCWLSLFTVDETEFVLVTQFGRTVAILGQNPGDPGLHLKWPWQSKLAIDRRLRVFDAPAREMITGDKRNLEVAAYVSWRVSDPLLFQSASGSLDAAEARLNERVSAALSDALGRVELANLASTKPNVWKLDHLTSQVRGSISARAQQELGVEVRDVGLRRFNHPIEVRPAVFDLIRSERKQVAERLRVEGESQYQILRSEAERERDVIVATAEAEAAKIKGQAEAEATRIMNQAHSQDVKLHQLVRTLETYKALLDEKTTLFLSSGSPLLRLLTQGPAEEMTPTAPGGQEARP